MADALQSQKVHAVHQDDFGPDYRLVVELLREKIGDCAAVICLVGRAYGGEPTQRPPEQPRRSFTQLEYEIAVALKKPVFVFVATEDCPLDESGEEPEEEECRALQIDHIKRLTMSDRVWMPFRSKDGLIANVRLMRFDPDSLAEGITTRISALLSARLDQPDNCEVPVGAVAWAHDTRAQFQNMLNYTLIRWHGRVQSEEAHEFHLDFDTPEAAVNAALELQHAVHTHVWKSAVPSLRIGIHVGQIVRYCGMNQSHTIQAGEAVMLCRRLCEVGREGQTLLTDWAFDMAREHVREPPFAPGSSAADIQWKSYGRYILSGVVEPIDLCEVGVAGEAPLTPPADGPGVESADSLEERRMRGWRPGIGQEIPSRPGWIIDRKLGEGGFGEVWVARHQKTRERRVFKFCFDATRLSSFKRELTLFRLLRDALGARPDIAQLLEVELNEAPYYLESEHIDGGNLGAWCKVEDRLASIPLQERLRLITDIAKAVAAAHSVGIIHKDIKPSNILMNRGSDGLWHPILADFGIGGVADQALLRERGITAAGFTQSLLDPGSSRTGSRMYQPPEVSAGRVASVQGDVFAMGVLLYQLLIGDFGQPLEPIGWEDRVTRALLGFRPKPSSRRQEARDEAVLDLLKGDLADCLIGDPEKRLASAAQLAERLDTFDVRVTNRLAHRRAERAAIRIRRLSAALTASILALIVVGGMELFAYDQWSRAERLEKDAYAARNKALASAQAAREQFLRALDGLTNMAGVLGRYQSVPDVNGIAEDKKKFLRSLLDELSQRIVEQSETQPADFETVDRYLDLAQAIIHLTPGDQHSDSNSLLLAFGSFMEMLNRDAPDVTERAAMQPTDLNGFLSAPSMVRLQRARTGFSVQSVERRLYERAEGTMKLAVLDKPDANTLNKLVGSYVELGLLAFNVGEPEKAKAHFARAEELLQNLLAEHPTDYQSEFYLSIVYGQLGHLHWYIGEQSKALRYYSQGLEIRTKLAQAEFDPHVDIKDQLMISYLNVGSAEMMLGQPSKAEEHLTKALEIGREKVEHGRATDLSIAYVYVGLGDAELQLGQTDKALECYTRVLQISQEHAAAHPDDAQVHSCLSVSYNRLGDLTLQLAQIDKAREYYTQALRIIQKHAVAEPTDASVQHSLWLSYNKVGDAWLRSGDVPKARELYENGLAVIEELAKADSTGAQARHDLAVSYEKLGDAWLRSGDSYRAREFYEKGLEVSEVLVEVCRKGDLDQRRLYFLYNTLSWLFATHWDERIRDGRRAVALATRACEMVEWKNANALDTLAAAFAEAGQFDESVKWSKEAITLGKDLPEKQLAQLKARLAHYEARKPIRQAKPSETPTPVER